MQPDTKILSSDGLLAIAVFSMAYSAVFLSSDNENMHTTGLILLFVALGSIAFRSWLKHLEKAKRKK